jgi:hypothetical protein
LLDAVENPRQVACFGAEKEKRDTGRVKGRGQVAGSKMADGHVCQLVYESGFRRREVRRQAEDRKTISKPGGLVNLMVEEKGEKPLVHQVMRTEGRQAHPRDHKRLRVELNDNSGNRPGMKSACRRM